jgi:hypothetical protein
MAEKWAIIRGYLSDTIRYGLVVKETPKTLMVRECGYRGELYSKPTRWRVEDILAFQPTRNACAAAEKRAETIRRSFAEEEAAIRRAQTELHDRRHAAWMAALTATEET